MQKFADFNHFIAFGQFLSIDLRVKVRYMVSGRIVKTFSVNTKCAEYTVLKNGVFDPSEVFVTIESMLADLAVMVKKEGFYVLGHHLDQVLSDARITRDLSGDDRALNWLIGRLFAQNHLNADVFWD